MKYNILQWHLINIGVCIHFLEWKIEHCENLQKIKVETSGIYMHSILCEKFWIIQ